MITNVRLKTFSHTISCASSFASRRTSFQATGDMLSLHTVGFEPTNIELDRLKEQVFFGIHFGISSCTAVKDQLKHRLEVPLQVYFTILFLVFHGKKAAKTHGACNFSIN